MMKLESKTETCVMKGSFMIKNIFIPSNYKDIVEDYEDICGISRWFAAANTPDGFVSYFREIFGISDIKKLYILGGGPGSGKSTIMKRVAQRCHERGLACELFHCSSSPFSLDGVLIPSLGTAVIDGTAPHTYDISLPGAREHYVDLGVAWNTQFLEERVGEITRLRDEKKKAYRRAYLHFKAYRLLEDESQALLKPYILTDKLTKYVASLSDKFIARGDGFYCDMRIQSGIGSCGCVYFDSFETMASNVLKISDFRGIGYLLTDLLLCEAKNKKSRCVLSYSPIADGKIDGIYFPDTNTCFSFYAESFDKNINCERFCDMRSLKYIKPKFDISHRCAANIFSEVCASLEEAGRLHDMIEKEYHPCTDYTKIEGITDSLLAKIF